MGAAFPKNKNMQGIVAMLKSHRRAAAIAAVALLALILVACGGGGGGGGSSSTTYTVGGTVSGLTVPGLVLQNNQGSDLTVNADGTFTFPSQTNGSTFAVSVKTQPASGGQQQTCTVGNGSGSVSGSNVSTVAVSCVTTACPQLTQPLPTSSVYAIVAYDFVSSSSAPNNQFDVKYKVRFQNTEPGLKAVAGTATATSGVTVVDGTAAFGDVGIYTTAVSSDDITLRQTAACATAAPALTWTVSSTVDVASQAGVLQGSSNALALTSTKNSWSGVLFSQAEVVQVPGTPGVIRSGLSIEFKGTATVGDINRILRRIGGEVVSMSVDAPFLVVRIPDPGSISTLQSLIAQLSAESAIAAVTYLYQGDRPDSLPEPFQTSGIDPSQTSIISDVLTMHTAPAWSISGDIASGLQSVGPRLLVPDFFGSDALSGGVAAQLTGISAAPTCAGNLDNFRARFGPNFSHGNAIVSKLAATFGSLSQTGLFQENDRLTSVLPVSYALPVQGRAIDLCLGVQSLEMVEDRIKTIIDENRQQGRHTVVNYSIGIPCNGLCSDEFVATQARRWLVKLRGSGNLHQISERERSFIFASSAGNQGSRGGVGKQNNQYAAATLRPDIPGNSAGEFSTRTRNTLVVENIRYSVTATKTLAPACLSPSSSSDGNISAVGSGLWVAPWNDARTEFLEDGGTSSSTPHVAGLAMAMWSLRSGLDSLDIIARILGSARSIGTLCAAPRPSSLLEVYGALLSLDELIAAGTTLQVPVRRAILNISGDTAGVFNAADVQQFASALAAARPGAPPDYGRADFNGDGYTGGSNRVAFNLNANRDANEKPIVSETLGVLVPPTGATIGTFNEAGLTDQQILCWYIYSPLYSGASSRQDAEDALVSAGLSHCATPAPATPPPNLVLLDTMGSGSLTCRAFPQVEGGGNPASPACVGLLLGTGFMGGTTGRAAVPFEWPSGGYATLEATLWLTSPFGGSANVLLREDAAGRPADAVLASRPVTFSGSGAVAAGTVVFDGMTIVAGRRYWLEPAGATAIWPGGTIIVPGTIATGPNTTAPLSTSTTTRLPAVRLTALPPGAGNPSTPTTWVYRGTITSMSGTVPAGSTLLPAGATAGDLFTVTISVNAATPDLDITSFGGAYYGAVQSMTLAIDGKGSTTWTGSAYLTPGTTFNTVAVQNLAPPSTDNVLIELSSAIRSEVFTVFLDDGTGTALTSDAFPPARPDPTRFLTDRRVTISVGGVVLSGQLATTP